MKNVALFMICSLLAVFDSWGGSMVFAEPLADGKYYLHTFPKEHGDAVEFRNIRIREITPPVK